ALRACTMPAADRLPPAACPEPARACRTHWIRGFTALERTCCFAVSGFWCWCVLAGSGDPGSRPAAAPVRLVIRHECRVHAVLATWLGHPCCIRLARTVLPRLTSGFTAAGRLSIPNCETPGAGSDAVKPGFHCVRHRAGTT